MNLDELTTFARDIALRCDAIRVDLIGGEHSHEAIVADLEVTLRPHDDAGLLDLTSRTLKARELRDEIHPDVAILFTFGHEDLDRKGKTLYEHASSEG